MFRYSYILIVLYPATLNKQITVNMLLCCQVRANLYFSLIYTIANLYVLIFKYMQ
jgi:hypothetical protein